MTPQRKCPDTDTARGHEADLRTIRTGSYLHATKDLAGLARCIKEARETAVYIGKTIGLWSDPKSSTIIDQRRQTLNIGSLSTDELRNLAKLAGGKADTGA